jgi:hypothetical protein
MPELVRVDAPSLDALEAFLRAEADPSASLGLVWLAAGHAGALVARVAGASAITLGQLVCLSQEHAALLRQRPQGALEALGPLLVHEAVHVWQWRRDGFAWFPLKYLYYYFTTLYQLRSFDRRTRDEAYRRIPAEQEAFAFEARWQQIDGS